MKIEGEIIAFKEDTHRIKKKSLHLSSLLWSLEIQCRDNQLNGSLFLIFISPL